MLSYIIGKVVYINTITITVENNFRGYQIFTNCPSNFEVGKVYKIYIHEIKNDYEEASFGFLTLMEKIIFKDLLSVSGLGTRTALKLLRKNVYELREAIVVGDYNALEVKYSINHKLAKQIVLNLQDKYDSMPVNSKNYQLKKELQIALVKLGYNKDEITRVFNNVSFGAGITIDMLIQEAIKLLNQ